VQPGNNKLLIGGYSSSLTGTAQSTTGINRVARLLSDGRVDGGFLAGTPTSAYGPNNTVRSMAIDADGLFVIVGDFTSYNAQGLTPPPTRNRIARIGGL